MYKLIQFIIIININLLYVQAFNNYENKPPGMYMQISKKGLDYLTAIGEKALPNLVGNVSIPEMEGDGFSLHKLVINKFGLPKINADFIDQGIQAIIDLPIAELMGVYSAGMGWFSTKGSFKARIVNLHLIMVLQPEFNEETKLTEFNMPVCNGSTENVNVLFGGQMSTVLNFVRPLIAEYLTNTLDSVLCDITIDATRLLGREIAQQQQSLPPDANDDNTGAQPKKLSTADFCDAAKMGTKEKEVSEKISDFSIDFNLARDPSFDMHRMVIPFNGEMLFNGKSAPNTFRPRLPQPIARGKGMLTFTVTEFPVNTFFYHVYNQSMGEIVKSLKTSEMPYLLRKMILPFCSTCEIKLATSLTAPPVITTNRNGVQLYIEGHTSMQYESVKRQVNIITAKVASTVLVKPYVQGSALYGKIDLDNVEVRIDNVTIGGVIGNSVGTFLKAIIPQSLWPKVQKRLNFALDRKGIKLPVVCGLELQNTTLSYIEHAVIIDTDIDFDVDSFIMRLAKLQKENRL